MKRLENKIDEIEDMPAEVDFSAGVRGRFAGRTGKNVTLVQIDEDVAQAFPSSEEVNAALRSLMKTSEMDRKVSERHGDEA